MNREKENISRSDPAAQDALRDEANKPEPLYNKTDRNFQQQYQGPQESNNELSEKQKNSSSSEEEKDII